MRVAIIGSRGIPAKYGGFEVFTEELSTKLSQKGYTVTVTCEEGCSDHAGHYQGVNLAYHPINPPKNYFFRKFYELFGDLYFLVRLSRRNDVILLLGMTAGSLTFLPKILSRSLKLVINIDGVEWKRDKFNSFEKAFLKFNTTVATKVSDAIILDAKSMAHHIDSNVVAKSVYIPYGVNHPVPVEWNNLLLNPLVRICPEIKNLKKCGFWLAVARLEPENNILTIIKGFIQSTTERPLVIVGNFSSPSYQEEVNSLLAETDKQIFLTGGIYNNSNLLDMLRGHCFAYIHGHSVGGTNPALLEAMSMKNVIIAHDNEFNREVCKESAMFFDSPRALADIVNMVESNPEQYAVLKQRAYDRVTKDYEWGKVVDAYDALFKELKTR